MTLGGWWRLWIAVSGVYALIVIAFVIGLWPTISSVAHHPSFIYRLSDESQKVLSKPIPDATVDLEKKLQDADRRGAITEARSYALELARRRLENGKPVYFARTMPNGYEIKVSADSTEPQRDRIGNEYLEVLNAELWKERALSILYGVLGWLCPVVLMCVFGLLFQWVRRGFKNPP